MKWKYLVQVFNPTDGTDETGAEFNRLGDEGWELVSVVANMGKDASWSLAYFKRPKSN